MRPSKAELIELLSRVLPDVPHVRDGFLSESALAEILAVDRRWLRELRTAGVVAPRRFGRGFVYANLDARICSVAARLAGLGLSTAAIVHFFEAPCDPVGCPRAVPACAPRDCCELLLRGHLSRLEADIDDLRRFRAALAADGTAPAGGRIRHLELVRPPAT